MSGVSEAKGLALELAVNVCGAALAKYLSGVQCRAAQPCDAVRTGDFADGVAQPCGLLRAKISTSMPPFMCW